MKEMKPEPARQTAMQKKPPGPAKAMPCILCGKYDENGHIFKGRMVCEECITYVCGVDIKHG